MSTAELHARTVEAVHAAYARCEYRKTALHVFVVEMHRLPSVAGNTLLHTIQVPEGWLTIPHAARVVSGRLTLSMGGLPTQPRIFAASRVVQGRGLSIKVEEGYIVDVGTAATARYAWANVLVYARRLRDQSPCQEHEDCQQSYALGAACFDSRNREVTP